MNTIEWIMIVQTTVLTITGFIIYWYTKLTEKIWKETSNQNNFLAEQLRMMKEQLLKEEKKERSLLEPLFIYNGGSISSDGINIRLINKGSTIRNIKINKLAISHSYFPKDILESDKEIRFHFNKFGEDLPEVIEFIIVYEDKFGEEREKEMILYPKKNKMVEK